jgi:hypothetical protein
LDERFDWFRDKFIELQKIIDSKKSVSWEQFYIDPPDPTLLDLDSSVNTFYHRRIYFWFPELFHKRYLDENPIKCIYCNANVRLKGWNYRGPRLVTALNGEYWVLFKQYQCTSKKCKKTFMGSDEDVLKQLPLAVSSKFPCIVFPKIAIDKLTVALLQMLVTSSLSFEKIHSICKELSNRTYNNTVLQYYTREKTLRKTGKLQL